jgi:catechol 2,3-dioxygenase-like lactoylglutathione lyase family enzyme
VISHVHIGINNFPRAFAFYEAVMPELGLSLKFSEPENAWAGWVSPHAARPLFLVGKPYNGEAATVGNGQMVALLAPSREAVDRVHALALRLGGSCEGEPGLRPHYHPDYYGAYFRDPDGNKIAICCHEPLEN